MRYHLTLAALVVLVLGLVSLVPVLLAPPWQAAQAQQQPRGTAWEYKLVVRSDLAPPLGSNLEEDRKLTAVANERFNKLGDDGWEYAGTHHVTPYVIFKRPKR